MSQDSIRPVREPTEHSSPACGASPSCFNVTCLLDADHQGPHRWWDDGGSMKWVPKDEPWRDEPNA
jgi:hypothetical protein